MLKVNGDLTVKQGVTLTSVRSTNDYGGPKGMMVYCTGTLKNDGNISMTCRGAYAKGENVYLYKNNDNSYEFIPEIGGVGGAGVNATWKRTGNVICGIFVGNVGGDGIGRATGGGGGGGCGVHIDSIGASTYANSGGKGSAGTSYSGGSGGGGSFAWYGGNKRWSGLDASNYGGAGGGTRHGTAGSVAPANGNPSGGTGGLLVVFTNMLSGSGAFSALGATSIEACWRGSSGGGSVNIFYSEKLDSYYGKADAYGEWTAATSASTYGIISSPTKTNYNGGAGSCTIGSISTGYFVQD